MVREFLGVACSNACLDLQEVLLVATYCLCVDSFLGLAQLSVACSTEKRGEPGIFSHVSDVTKNKK